MQHMVVSKEPNAQIIIYCFIISTIKFKETANNMKIIFGNSCHRDYDIFYSKY